MNRVSLALLVLMAACAERDPQPSTDPEAVQSTATLQTATFALG